MRQFLMILLACLALPAAARPPSLVPGDAPALAAPGLLPVGVRETRFTAGPARNLGLTLFYPAAKRGSPTTYPHVTPQPPAGFPAKLVFEGIATRDSAPATGPKLPLILLSHGLGRWSTAMSGMAENLASKGYVVASIDHDDSGAMDPARRLQVFGTAYARRSADQRAAIAFLTGFAASKDPLGPRIDPQNIAVIGYSMGGYGALATGGAGHDPKAPLSAQLPKGALDGVLESVAPAPGVRALVLIAPWGGLTPVRSFTPRALAGLTMPSLWIMGDKDDVAGTTGIQWLHDNASASDRYLLVFANARHNLGGNPPPASAPDTGRLRDAIDEPVWRKDMADAIIFHSLTAFLDQHLKGDPAKGEWLAAAPDGTLKGFQNRWQLGISLTHTAAQ
jgi:pimeloyl-ACP methyl ester carboxylesterase